jgi:hypothetical protein
MPPASLNTDLRLIFFSTALEADRACSREGFILCAMARTLLGAAFCLGLLATLAAAQSMQGCSSAQEGK